MNSGGTSSDAFINSKRVGNDQLLRRVLKVEEPASLGENMARGAVFYAFKEAVERANSGHNVYTHGAMVRVNDETVRIPDCIVQENGFGRARLVARPWIIADMKFPETSAIDIRQRFEDYLSVDSIAHYLVVDRERRLVLQHERRMDGRVVTHIIRQGVIAFDEFEVQVGKLLGDQQSDFLGKTDKMIGATG
jgi:hypothetical protein